MSKRLFSALGEPEPAERRVQPRVEKDVLTQVIDLALSFFRKEIKSRLDPGAQLALSLVNRGLHLALALGPYPFTSVDMFLGGTNWKMLCELPPARGKLLTDIATMRFVRRAVDDGADATAIMKLLGVLCPTSIDWKGIIRDWPAEHEALLTEIVMPWITDEWWIYTLIFYAGFRRLFDLLVKTRSTRHLRQEIRASFLSHLAGEGYTLAYDATVALLRAAPVAGVVPDTRIFSLFFIQPSCIILDYSALGIYVTPNTWEDLTDFPPSERYHAFLQDVLDPTKWVDTPGFSLSPFLWDEQLDTVFCWRWHVQHMTPVQLGKYKATVCERGGWDYIERHMQALARVLTPSTSNGAPHSGV